jgi:hypothetical protein
LPGSTSESHTIEHDIDPETGRRIPVAVSTSTYHPGQRSEFKEQTVTKVIRMFKGTRPAGDLGAYDAKSMIEMMGPTIPRSEDTTH